MHFTNKLTAEALQSAGFSEQGINVLAGWSYVGLCHVKLLSLRDYDRIVELYSAQERAVGAASACQDVCRVAEELFYDL